jgi:hypothetical protein
MGRKRKLVETKKKTRVVRKPRGKKDSDKEEIELNDTKHDDVVRLHVINGVNCWISDRGKYAYDDTGYQTAIVYQNTIYYHSRAPPEAIAEQKKAQQQFQRDIADLGLEL